jgi:cytochrome c-type biogenesis protein CcmF
MIVESGHYALVLALAVALVQASVPLWGGLRKDPQLMAMAPAAAVTQFILIAASFAALTYAHVVSDFSVVNVFENSHSAKPLIYKITGVWGNHEGSMLLWVLILSLFGALVAMFSRAMPDDLRALTLAAQGWISAAFLIFILLTSNPFARMWPAPAEGQDLNPLLQDPGLAIHPPLLYLGYVGFSITFSFAAAALLSGRIDAAWARYVRPWTLLAWLFLTLGIAMGSYWSYYTLGWGGFWFWDPVENASLMPWLAGTALLHSATVMEKRDALKVWTIFLAVLAFSLSLLGTFLVRSGVLTSVHAFATDPRRGVYILIILVFFIGGSLGLFAVRAPMLRPGGLFAPISREGALVLNNLLLTTCCATVLVGTLYPLALESLTGTKISVGAPFFNLTFVPLFVPIFLAMPIGQMLAWKRGDLLGAAQRLMAAAAIGCAAALLIGSLRGGSVAAAVASGLAVYLIIGSFVEVFGRVVGGGLKMALSRARGLPRSAWGAACAHAGAGVCLLGLAATAWGVESILAVRPGQEIPLGPYMVQVGQMTTGPGPNYQQTTLPMTVRDGGRTVAIISPSRRDFPVRQMTVSQAGLATVDFGQVYVSLGDSNANGTYDAHLYWKPLVTLIWLGGVLMAFGGLLSLSDRRLRVGAPRVARARTPPASPAASPQPAE